LNDLFFDRLNLWFDRTERKEAEEVAEGIKDMKKLDVVNADLKPDNIILFWDLPQPNDELCASRILGSNGFDPKRYP